MEIQKDSSEISREEFMSLIIKYNNNIANNPNDHKSYFDRANCYLNLGNLRDALNDQNIAIELAERMKNISKVNKARYYSERGYVNACMSNLEQAFKDYDMAVKLNPTSEMYYNRGVANYNLKHYEEAKNDYEQAVALNPNHHKAISSLADIVNKLNESEKQNLQPSIGIYKFKVLNDTVQALKDELHYKPENKKDKVYQYRSMNSMNILFHNKIDDEEKVTKSLKFRLNNAVHMNDPLEGDMFNEYLIRDETNDENFLKFINIIYPKDKIDFEYYAYLSSFSKNNGENILPMWTNYANDTNGFKIAIPTKSFELDETDKSNNHNISFEDTSLYDIVYFKMNNDNEPVEISLPNDAEKKNRIENHIIRIKEELKNIYKLNGNKLTDDDKKQIRQILDIIRFLFKSDVYAYEEEVRLLNIVDRVTDNNKVKTYENIDDVLKVPKLYIELEKDIPYEEVSITLGAKVQKPKEIANYLRHIGVGKVTKSKMPYQ